MAGRPPKKGIDYSGWSVDIFDNDTKIDKLLEARGWEGFGIYFYLCQRAYGGEGYFYKWSYDDCASTSRKMSSGISAGTVRETVDYCLHLDLFNKGLFDRQGILTSRGIQRRYWEVIKARDVRAVISDYWLLQDDECKGLIKIPLNRDLSKGNTDFPSGNADFVTGKGDFPTQKESKVKERKVKNKKSADAPEDPCEAYYPNDAALNQAFIDYMDMRKKIRKPMTERAVVLAMNKLQELSSAPFSDAMDHDTAIKILEQSTLNCWQGIFPLKESKNRAVYENKGIDWNNV